MAEYTLNVALEGRVSMNGLDKYDLDERVETLRRWLPNVDLHIVVDDVQADDEIQTRCGSPHPHYSAMSCGREPGHEGAHSYGIPADVENRRTEP